MSKKSDPDTRTQKEKFEDAAKEFERLHGEVPAAALDALIGAAGETRPVSEAKARKKAGLPPASH